MQQEEGDTAIEEGCVTHGVYHPHVGENEFYVEVKSRFALLRQKQ